VKGTWLEKREKKEDGGIQESSLQLQYINDAYKIFPYNNRSVQGRRFTGVLNKKETRRLPVINTNKRKFIQSV
jgi:hypothetical protein